MHNQQQEVSTRDLTRPPRPEPLLTPNGYIGVFGHIDIPTGCVCLKWVPHLTQHAAGLRGERPRRRTES